MKSLMPVTSFFLKLGIFVRNVAQNAPTQLDTFHYSLISVWKSLTVSQVFGRLPCISYKVSIFREEGLSFYNPRIV